MKGVREATTADNNRQSCRKIQFYFIVMASLRPPILDPINTGLDDFIQHNPPQRLINTSFRSGF